MQHKLSTFNGSPLKKPLLNFHVVSSSDSDRKPTQEGLHKQETKDTSLFLPSIHTPKASNSIKPVLSQSPATDSTLRMPTVTTIKNFIEPKKRGYFDFEENSPTLLRNNTPSPQSKKLLKFVLNHNEPQADDQLKRHSGRGYACWKGRPDESPKFNHYSFQGQTRAFDPNQDNQDANKSFVSHSNHSMHIPEKPSIFEKERRKMTELQADKCSICMGQRFNSTVLHCGHSFCKNCIKNALVNSIDVRSFPLKCPHPNCSKQITIHDIWRIVPVPDFKVYEKILNRPKQKSGLKSRQIQSPLLSEPSEPRPMTNKNPIRLMMLKKQSLKLYN